MIDAVALLIVTCSKKLKSPLSGFLTTMLVGLQVFSA
jgi:hypothetical protein